MNKRMKSTSNFDEKLTRFIRDESAESCNPYLSTRVLAALQAPARQDRMTLAWKTSLATISLALALFAGISAGNLYGSEKKGNEVVLSSDDQMEQLGFYTQLGNE